MKKFITIPVLALLLFAPAPSRAVTSVCIQVDDTVMIGGKSLTALLVDAMVWKHPKPAKFAGSDARWARKKLRDKAFGVLKEYLEWLETSPAEATARTKVDTAAPGITD